MVYGIPSITFLVMCSMPACLQLSFMATSVLGMAQGKLLMRDTVRNFLGLYPLYKPQPMPQPAVEDKKTQIKRMRTSQNQGRSVMKGYQPPTVASSVRNLSVKGAPIATATAPQRPGILGGISRFLKTRILNPLGKSSRNMMQEALALRGKASKQETKEEKEKKRRAQDYERRRTREIEEDAKYRRDNVEYKNAR